MSDDKLITDDLLRYMEANELLIEQLKDRIKELEANQIFGRCKECEHRFEHKTISRYFCDRLGVYVEDYEFCARFDKREE